MDLVCRLLLEKNFFNDTATTEIYTLSLHDALPIYVYLKYNLLRAIPISDYDTRTQVGYIESKKYKQIGRAHV